MPIIAIITDPTKGGVFLSWTLNYLAGHTQYFHAKTNSWFALPDNPLTTINAHNFNANQCPVYSQLDTMISNLLNCNSTQFSTLYFHNLIEWPWSLEWADTKKAINDVKLVAEKIILLTNQPKNYLYDKSYKIRSESRSYFNPEIRFTSEKEVFDDYINFFYKDSVEKWKELNLTSVWDMREFLALNSSANGDSVSVAPLFDLTSEHYSIDCLEWFNSGDLLVEDLCNYLNKAIDNNRLLHWNQIYQTWRKIHYNRLNFTYCFDKIINYILNGYYMDLVRFDLDIIQESFIQNELIYKHNLNLKTWQLEKFINTQQLHALLEPNIHALTNKKL